MTRAHSFVEARNDIDVQIVRCLTSLPDPCPVQTMIGFDYADKKKSVPFGPMSWPTGFQSGDDAEFIKKSNVMLGIADTSKFQAVCEHQ